VSETAEIESSTWRKLWDFCGHFSRVIWIVTIVIPFLLWLVSLVISLPPFLAGGVTFLLLALSIIAAINKLSLNYRQPFLTLGGLNTDPSLIDHDQPKAITAKTTPKPEPNIQMLGLPRKTLVERDDNFVFREVLNSARPRWAVVVDFQNKLELGQQIKGLDDVLSHLTFLNTTGDLSWLLKRGFWLEQASPRATFGRGDTRTLFIALIQETQAGTYITTYENKHDEQSRLQTPPITFSPNDSISVKVVLFTQTRHRFHKECEIQLTPEIAVLNPLVA
jgi:hypothetical protein